MDDRKREFFEKEIIKPRLTVTKDRVTLKVPIGTSQEDVRCLTWIAEFVAKDLQDVSFSMRGTICLNNERFTLCSDNKKDYRTYSYERKLNEFGEFEVLTRIK